MQFRIQAALLTLCLFFLRFRVLCHWLCNHTYFGNIILVCILVSSALLALEDPIPDKDNKKAEASIHRIVVYGRWLNWMFFISDFDQVWLHFYWNIFSRITSKDNFVRVYSPQGCLSKIRLQCSGFGGSLCLFGLHF